MVFHFIEFADDGPDGHRIQTPVESEIKSAGRSEIEIESPPTKKYLTSVENIDKNMILFPFVIFSSHF